MNKSPLINPDVLSAEDARHIGVEKTCNIYMVVPYRIYELYLLYGYDSFDENLMLHGVDDYDSLFKEYNELIMAHAPAHMALIEVNITFTPGLESFLMFQPPLAYSSGKVDKSLDFPTMGLQPIDLEGNRRMIYGLTTECLKKHEAVIRNATPDSPLGVLRSKALPLDELDAEFEKVVMNHHKGAVMETIANNIQPDKSDTWKMYGHQCCRQFTMSLYPLAKELYPKGKWDIVELVGTYDLKVGGMQSEATFEHMYLRAKLPHSNLVIDGSMQMLADVFIKSKMRLNDAVEYDHKFYLNTKNIIDYDKCMDVANMEFFTQMDAYEFNRKVMETLHKRLSDKGGFSEKMLDSIKRLMIVEVK